MSEFDGFRTSTRASSQRTQGRRGTRPYKPPVEPSPALHSRPWVRSMRHCRVRWLSLERVTWRSLALAHATRSTPVGPLRRKRPGAQTYSNSSTGKAAVPKMTSTNKTAVPTSSHSELGLASASLRAGLSSLAGRDATWSSPVLRWCPLATGAHPVARGRAANATGKRSNNRAHIRACPAILRGPYQNLRCRYRARRKNLLCLEDRAWSYEASIGPSGRGDRLVKIEVGEIKDSRPMWCGLKCTGLTARGRCASTASTAKGNLPLLFVDAAQKSARVALSAGARTPLVDTETPFVL